VGGPLALVKDGDIVELDVPARRLYLEVSDEELARRKAAWVPPKQPFARGFGVMHQLHVTQANKGCDFDFLEEPVAETGAAKEVSGGEPEIH
jgi:dihydroxy-acid dehydratase